MTTDDLVRELAADLQPVRRLRAVEQRTWVWGLLALGLVLAGVWAFGLRPDLVQKLSDRSFLAEVTALVVLCVLASRSAFHLSVPGLEHGWSTLARPAAALAVWALLVAARYPGEDPGSLSLNGLWCVLKLSMLSFAPTVAAFLMLRKAAPLRRAWTGGCALLAAGALAMVGVETMCAHDGAAHVLVFHVLPVAVAAVLGAAAGRWFLDRAPAR
jgi:hypothetical protein